MDTLVDASAWRALSLGDRGARDRIIESYLPFARHQAKAVYRRTGHALMDWNDYVQSATEGLIEAVDRFDVGTGLPFEVFAGIRVRGAVFNAIRALCDRGGDRGKAAWALRWRERTQLLGESETGGLDAFISVVVGLGVGFLLEHEAEPCGTTDPAYSLEVFQLQRTLHLALDKLPERERLILRLHYMNHIPFQDIAATLALSKGRVSQLHHQALRRLRDRLRSEMGAAPNNPHSPSVTLEP
jgi:RNA polymerase sigma factor for flagellar operon FliA